MTTLGCLTGNGRPPQVAGTYRFLRRGTREPFQPDLPGSADGADPAAGGEGPAAGDGGAVPFDSGALTDGDPATAVGWRGRSVGEIGPYILVEFGQRLFVDRVVLRQAHPASGPTSAAAPRATDAAGAAPSPGRSESDARFAAVTGVEVLCREAAGGVLQLAGVLGAHDPLCPFPDPDLAIQVGLEAEALVVRLSTCHRDVRLAELEVWGSAPGEPRIYPFPEHAAFAPAGDAFRLTERTRIVVAGGADGTWEAEAHFAANLLAERLAEEFGADLAVLPAADAGSDQAGATLTLGVSSAAPGPDAPDAPDAPGALDADAYWLEVRADGVRLLAGGRRGLIYGVCTLLQLLRRDGGAVTAPACVVHDRPQLALRGVHLFLPAREDIGFVKRLIRYVLTPLRYNTLFLQVTAGMRFDRRPEINETWERLNRQSLAETGAPLPHGRVGGGSFLTKEEVRDLVRYARDYGLEVIPEIQSLSHVQYLTLTYPEIAERPEDARPDAYCPLHPLSHRIVFDLIDEIVEVFEPQRYVHMGHDEVYTMGVCERCQGKSRADLLLADVQPIYAHLEAKGLGMMLWGDMLHPFPWYAAPDAIDRLPKDVVLLDFVWYFRPQDDIEDRLLDHGFTVAMGNYYSSHYTRFAQRAAKPGVIGGEVSTWCGADEDDLGRNGKLYDLLYSANTLWTAGWQEEVRWTVDRKIAALMPAVRDRLRGSPAPSRQDGARFAPVDLAAALTAPLRDETGAKGGYDLAALPRGHVELRGIPFRVGDGVVAVESPTALDRLPATVDVPLAGQADSLLFLYACSAESRPQASITRRMAAQPMAQFLIRYDDGEAAVADVVYGWHVAEWRRRHGAPLAHFAHRHSGYVATYPADPFWQGKTPAGEDVTLYGLEWINPHPGRAIRSVALEATEAAGCAALLLAAITRVTRSTS